MAIAKPAPAPAVRHEPPKHEPMRIAGRRVDAEGVVEVRYLYTDAVIGTVPAGTAAHAREAFEIAAASQPTLHRHERPPLLLRAAGFLVASSHTNSASDSGPSRKGTG